MHIIKIAKLIIFSCLSNVYKLFYSVSYWQIFITSILIIVIYLYLNINFIISIYIFFFRKYFVIQSTIPILRVQFVINGSVMDITYGHTAGFIQIWNLLNAGCVPESSGKKLMSQCTWKAFTMRVKRISSVTFVRKFFSIKEPLIGTFSLTQITICIIVIIVDNTSVLKNIWGVTSKPNTIQNNFPLHFSDVH